MSSTEKPKKPPDRHWYPKDAGSRKARSEPCDRCGRIVWRGLDHDRVPSDVRCDKVILTERQIQAADIAGLKTHHLDPIDGGWELYLRNTGLFANPYRDRDRIVPDHVCDIVWPDLELKTPKTTTPESCPF